MKSTNIICLLMVSMFVSSTCNQARNRIKLQAKVKTRLKKLSIDQKNQANDML